MRKGVKLISQSGFDYQPRNKEGGHDFIDLEEPSSAIINQNEELYGLAIKKLATRSDP